MAPKGVVLSEQPLINTKREDTQDVDPSLKKITAPTNERITPRHPGLGLKDLETLDRMEKGEQKIDSRMAQSPPPQARTPALP
mmetsp:Transcript_15904/g.24526  ORF Transcript_15904/g.24526 Transcript_15904/m.24526 type:complete len:83 (+) Transcript_15904:571-819(+)